MDENRLKHSIAVGRKMTEIGKARGLNDNELQELFVLGYNHDIGYEFKGNKDHARIGGKILKNSKYEYWREIYHHGNARTTYQSLYLDILNLADMQIDSSGRDIGFEKRLENIKSRYGAKSNTYKDALLLVQKLKKLAKEKPQN